MATLISLRPLSHREGSLTAHPDQLLLGLTRDGVDAAFAVVVARYWVALVKYVTPMVGPHRAEDVVQSTLLKGYEAVCSGHCDSHLRAAWLYRVAYNAAVDVLREHAGRDSALDERAHAGAETPELAVERAEGVRELIAALKVLPERQRAALVQRELEGRSYQEIAGAMDTTGSAVRQLLARARENLRSAAAALAPIGLDGAAGPGRAD